jgi:hypothetical protein
MGERRDGLGELWDRWVEHVNAPDAEDEPDKEPWTLRRVLETAAAAGAVVALLVVADQFVDFNWGWVPWKSLAVIGFVLAALMAGLARAVRSLVRRMRGRPPLEGEPTKRDRLAEKVRELDEPYLRRERSLTRD